MMMQSDALLHAGPYPGALHQALFYIRIPREHRPFKVIAFFSLDTVSQRIHKLDVDNFGKGPVLLRNFKITVFIESCRGEHLSMSVLFSWLSSFLGTIVAFT